MNILLIAPSIGLWSDNSGYDPYRERIFLAPPQGLHQISSFLGRLGHNAVVYDPNFLPDAFLEVLDTSWDIIGFSPTHIFLEHDLDLFFRAKKQFPGAKFILGGMEATFDAERLLRISGADAIVIGEGENTVAELCATDDWNKVRGLYVPLDGQGHFTGHRQPLDQKKFAEMVMGVDLERIPYRQYWDHISKKYDSPLSEQQKTEIQTIRLYTSNYCPGGCTFCAATRFRAHMAGYKVKVVGLEADQVYNMIERILTIYPDTRTIFFSDDNFLAWPGRAREICDLIVKAKHSSRIPKDLSFITSTTIYQVDAGLLDQMGTAGFRVLDCGLESLSPRMLKEFGRPNNMDRIYRNIDLLIKSPIQPYFTLILTSPESKLDDIVLTLERSLYFLEQGVHISINNYCWALHGSMIVRPNTLVRRRSVRVAGTDIAFEKDDVVLPHDSQVRRLLEEYEVAYSDIRDQWITAYRLSHFRSQYNSLAILAAWFTVLGRKVDFDRVMIQLEREMG